MPLDYASNKPRFLLGPAVTPPAADPAYLYYEFQIKEASAIQRQLDASIPLSAALRAELIRLGGGANWKKTFGVREAAKEYEATVLSGDVYWRFPKPVAATAGPPYENNAREWLVYEQLFNHEKFQKQNQQIEMGSYLIALDRVKIFLCQDIEAGALEKLQKAFFPDLTPEQLGARSATDCPWKPAPSTPPPLSGATPSALSASRDTNVARTGVKVAMPFNFHDAGGEESDYAIGGLTRSHLGAPLIHLDHTWPMWKSASRSCICTLGPIKNAGEDWPAPKNPQAWTVMEGETRVKDLPNLAKGGNYFKLADDTDKKAFSVKTGVNFVGKVNQSGDNAGGKNRLETNSIDACIRSDLVTLLDTKAGKSPDGDPHLLILKELLSITEYDPRKPLELGDGMQVRDLSVLERDKKYICPISIMYLDREMKKMQARYAKVADQTWVDFWRDAYAIPLGRAKALLLLRYAMQMGSPNAQNYLIEFEDRSGTLHPTGRIVTRDLGDAQIHREILWAFDGPEGQAPPRGGHPWKVDAGEALERKVIEEFYLQKARDLQPLVTELLTKLETEAAYPPVALSRVPAREMPAKLAQHLDGVVQAFLTLKSDADLTRVVPALQAIKGKHPAKDAVEFDDILAAAKRGIPKPSGPPLRNLVDESVSGDIAGAHAIIARDVKLAPVKYEFGVLRAIKSYVMESGAVDPSRSYGSYAGAQLRWTMFSALTRGQNVSSNSASTDQGIRDPGWQRVLEVNAYWGQAHNRQYVATLEECLGLKIDIPWGDAYAPERYATAGPGRYAALANDAYETAGAYYKEDVLFEHIASSVIQDMLISPEGQAAVRAYHGRKWAPAPKKTL